MIIPFTDDQSIVIHSLCSPLLSLVAYAHCDLGNVVAAVNLWIMHEHSSSIVLTEPAV